MKASTLKKKQLQVLTTPELRALFAVPRVPETTFSVRVPQNLALKVKLSARNAGKLQQTWIIEALEEALAKCSTTSTEN
jgi:hypothetical protein